MVILFVEVNDSFVFLLFLIDLMFCIYNDNVLILNLVELIFERILNLSWVVVFKVECIFYYLMLYGNEVRFVDCLFIL